LAEDVVGDFFPGEALPDGERDCDGWVEVAAGDRSAGYDCKGDTETERETDLEDVAIEWDGESARGSGGIDRERCNCGDAREDVKEDPCGFGYAFSEESRSPVLVVEFPLTDWLGWDNMAS